MSIIFITITTYILLTVTMISLKLTFLINNIRFKITKSRCPFLFISNLIEKFRINEQEEKKYSYLNALGAFFLYIIGLSFFFLFKNPIYAFEHKTWLDIFEKGEEFSLEKLRKYNEAEFANLWKVRVKGFKNENMEDLCKYMESYNRPVRIWDSCTKNKNNNLLESLHNPENYPSKFYVFNEEKSAYTLKKGVSLLSYPQDNNGGVKEGEDPYTFVEMNNLVEDPYTFGEEKLISYLLDTYYTHSAFEEKKVVLRLFLDKIWPNIRYKEFSVNSDIFFMKPKGFIENLRFQDVLDDIITGYIPPDFESLAEAFNSFV